MRIVSRAHAAGTCSAVDEEQWLRDGLAACDTILEGLGEADADSALIDDVKALRTATEAKLEELTSEASGSPDRPS